jgi:hypothetical protein
MPGTTILTSLVLKDVEAVATSDSVVAVRPILDLQIPQYVSPPGLVIHLIPINPYPNRLVRDQVLNGLTDPALPPDTQSTHVMTVCACSNPAPQTWER